jgi:hypothetical protein
MRQIELDTVVYCLLKIGGAMKGITRLSLALIMFSLFSISYLVTSVSAQKASDCMNHPAGSAARTMCMNKYAAPGSAAAGHMNQGYQGGAPGSAAATGKAPLDVDCSMFPGTGAARRSVWQKRRSSS